MKRLDCQSDIVARARRYSLSREEQAQLDEHLAGCTACRMAQQIGADFDAIAGVRPGDGALLQGLADRLVPRRARAGWVRASVRKMAVAAAAVCALLGAAAGAYALIDRGEGPRTPPAEATLQRVSSASPEEVEVVASAASRERRIDAPRAADAPIPPHRTHAHARSHRAAAETEESPPESAALLFTNANTERRLGHAAEAIALYGALETRYPAAEEASAARVSLGRLLLAHGQSDDALRQLDAYLSTSPDGTLAPEALFGEAQALQQLGRRDPERSAWQRLVEKFPNSVYTAQARRRLQDLR